MVRTFVFIYRLQENEAKRKEIHSLMNSDKNEEIDIGGWRLLFEQERRTVVVTSNGTDDYLRCKFIPAEIEYDTLIHLMDPSKHKEKIELKIRFLE